MLLNVFVMAGDEGRGIKESNIKDVTFVSSSDKTEQKYVLVLPDGFKAGQPHDMLIALHGHGSDRWQFVRDGRAECKAVRDAAVRHGMILVSPDYRAKTSWMGPKAEADMVQIIQELKKQYRIDKVVISGASMGGTGCLTFAVRQVALVNGVVSMNGTANLVDYDKFQDAISASFGGTKAQVPDEYKARSAEFWPDKLTMPVGFAVGGKDTTVPPESVVRLADNLKKQNRKVLLVNREAGGHSTNYEDATTILEFVITQVKSPSSANTQPATAGASTKPAR
ncbi:MAG: prolyl oligopeptidase family serine peptidase [Planctomycetes bacterium]|nr:prolyl oligopeptidase family serine peptidase [Planctomycetota bacterium]